MASSDLVDVQLRPFLKASPAKNLCVVAAAVLLAGTDSAVWDEIDSTNIVPWFEGRHLSRPENSIDCSNVPLAALFR
jgi:hypothetical protein